MASVLAWGGDVICGRLEEGKADALQSQDNSRLGRGHSDKTRVNGVGAASPESNMTLGQKGSPFRAVRKKIFVTR
jgi:hypothetical protein